MNLPSVWGNPEFTEYVNLLADQANAALAATTSETQAQAETAFLRVAELEAAFWQMAFARE